MELHPLILHYSQTTQHDFPLILVVGREPNNDSISDKKLGCYDFDAPQNRRCAFWNVAFSILGKFNGVSTKQIKQELLRRGASPIIFTDAFPNGIKNSVLNKRLIRKSQEKDLLEQVSDIFSHKEIIERTKLILLSGLHDEIFCPFKTLVLEKVKAESHGIEVCCVPFFYPTNTPKITDALNQKAKILLTEGYSSFMQATA